MSEEVALNEERCAESQFKISTQTTSGFRARARPYRLSPRAQPEAASGVIGSDRIIDPHRLVFCEGDKADHYFRVQEGTIHADKFLVDGRRQIIGIFFPGDYFGFPGSGEYEYSAEAAGTCRIVRYKRSQLFSLVDRNPSVAKRLVATMASEIRAAREEALLLGCRAPIQRVSTFLLMLAERRDTEDEAPIRLDMTREEIGNYLGLCMETVSRCISRLRANRIIASTNPQQFVIVDRDALVDLADPEILEGL